MNDLEEIDSGLNFNKEPDPVSVHENWIMRKLHDMEMASEMRIKGETMGVDTRTYITEWGVKLFQAAAAGEVAKDSNNQESPLLTATTLLVFSGIFREISNKISGSDE